MIVTGVESVPLRIPLTQDRRSATSAWSRADRAAVDSLLVRVTTDQGLEGWGEAFGMLGVPVARSAVDYLVAPLCIGRDASQIAALMRDLQQALLVFGRGGPVTHALSAVDIALWDIAGKAADAPLHRLLGGGLADLGCYASIEAYADPSRVRARARQALEDGFTSLKLHETDISSVRGVREEVGPGTELMLDVNCAWTVDEVRRLAAELRDLRLRWLEEPVWPPEDYDGLAELRRLEGIPIAAGENVATLMDFDRLLGAGAVDFVQPSPAKMGGVTELCKVFSLAAVHNVPVMPHSYYDGPGLLAATQVTAALGTAESMVEWRYFDLEARIYGAALGAEGGRIDVPQGPGLGIDPDPEVMRAYRTP
jgi:L-alanine-DL-glutamate epimerase-like enolase superfamily enzyme